MKKFGKKFGLRASAVAVVFVLITCSAAPLSAQSFGNGQPGEDSFSVGVLFGQFDPQTTYRDGGRFESRSFLGVAGSWWGHRYAGLNAGISFTETEGVAPNGGASLVTGQDPKQVVLHVDGLLRVPVSGAGAVTGFPYVAAGIGWKHYRFSRVNSHPEWNLAWSYALGGEVRLGEQGRLGLRVEFRDVRSNFERWGEDLTQSDRLLTTALMLNL